MAETGVAFKPGVRSTSGLRREPQRQVACCESQCDVMQRLSQRFYGTIQYSLQLLLRSSDEVFSLTANAQRYVVFCLRKLHRTHSPCDTFADCLRFPFEPFV